MAKLCFYTDGRGQLHNTLTYLAARIIEQEFKNLLRRPGKPTRGKLAARLGLDRNQLRRWITVLDVTLPF